MSLITFSGLFSQPNIVERMEEVRSATTFSDASRKFAELTATLKQGSGYKRAACYLEKEVWPKRARFLDSCFDYSLVYGVHTDNHSEALIRSIKNSTEHLRSHCNRRLSDVVRLLATSFSRRYVWDRALLQASRLGVYRGDERTVKRQRLESAMQLLQQHTSLADDAETQVLGYRNEEGKFYVQSSTREAVYDVDLTGAPRCSCADHKAGHLCKHILFVAWATTPSLAAAGLSGVGDAPYKQVQC